MANINQHIMAEIFEDTKVDLEITVSLADIGKKIEITEDLIKEGLYEICESVHSQCSDECPVYRMNGSSVPHETDTPFGCDCFKSGTDMLNFIKSKA